MKKNTTHLFFLFNYILIFYCNNFNADIVFNKNIVFNGNLIVNNNISVNNAFNLSNINGTTNISGDFIIDYNTESTVIFGNKSNLQMQSTDYFTGASPIYLMIDSTNNQVYSTTILRNNLNVNTLSVNNIISNPNTDLVIGSGAQNITIGNGENKIIFEKNLLINNQMTTNQDAITINGDVNFINNYRSNNITMTNADIIISPIQNTMPILFQCENFTINEPLEFYNSFFIGKNDLSSIININGYIFTQNITLGTINNPVLRFEGLPITNNPEYYLINNTDNTVSKIETTDSELPTIMINTLELDEINVNKISGSMLPHNIICFKSPNIIITTDNLLIERNDNDRIQIAQLNCNAPIIFNKGVYANSAVNTGVLIYSNTININPIVQGEFIAFFQSESSGFKINTMIFNFQNYYFKNLTSNESILGTLCLDISSNNLVYAPVSVDNTTYNNKNIDNINPVIYTYNDIYDIKNKDICAKTKKKIVHFGFIAEELEKLNLPELIKYDINSNIYDYDSDLLWLILEKKIIHYQTELTQIGIELEKINLKNQAFSIKIENKKNTIKSKKNIYQKIKKYINDFNKRKL